VICLLRRWGGLTCPVFFLLFWRSPLCPRTRVTVMHERATQEEERKTAQHKKATNSTRRQGSTNLSRCYILIYSANARSICLDKDTFWTSSKKEDAPVATSEFRLACMAGDQRGQHYCTGKGTCIKQLVKNNNIIRYCVFMC
jgi:hypothetical protein